MTVLRFLTLLIIFALAFSNGAAVATAMCQHQDEKAHALARASSDERIAAQALGEESAESTSSKKGALSDAAATWLSGYALPSEPPAFPLLLSGTMHAVAGDGPELAGRSPAPLLKPPLG